MGKKWWPSPEEQWGKFRKGLGEIADDIGLTDTEGQAERTSLLEDSLSELQGIPEPDLQDINLSGPEWQGDLSYEDILAEQSGDSAYNDISIDPRLRSDQYSALDSLSGLAESGGMTAQDEANLVRIQNQTATADKGRRDAIMQNMQQRGFGGSGMELLQQLQSNQSATNRAAEQGLNVAGMAQDRALQAIQMGGNMAGNIRGQDFNQQARQAQATDALNRFNTSQRSNTKQFNAQNRFGADQANWQGRQGTANAQNEAANQSQMYNRTQLPQSKFDNSMNKWQGSAQARGQQVGNSAANSAENSRASAEVASAGIKGITKIFSDDNKGK